MSAGGCRLARVGNHVVQQQRARIATAHFAISAFAPAWLELELCYDDFELCQVDEAVVAT
jgi:hypothetical protein